jgi:hypothetical protein
MQDDRARAHLDDQPPETGPEHAEALRDDQGTPRAGGGTQRPQQAQLPAVSCICLTYGRPALLEEAIESFLRQDYLGQKELIVLNDHDEQTLWFDHPEVRVINIPYRFRTVGEKCNAAIALASHDLIFVWDDDDIYLPHRISFSVDHFDPAQGFFKPRQAWFLDGDTVSGPLELFFHVGSCWSRELYDRVQGYAPMGNGYDQEIEARFEEVAGGSTTRFEIEPADIYYIYHWGGTSSYHMSGMVVTLPGENQEQQAVSEYVERQIRAGDVPRGEITLAPHWRLDYASLVQGCLNEATTSD